MPTPDSESPIKTLTLRSLPSWNLLNNSSHPRQLDLEESAKEGLLLIPKEQQLMLQKLRKEMVVNSGEKEKQIYKVVVKELDFQAKRREVDELQLKSL